MLDCSCITCWLTIAFRRMHKSHDLLALVAADRVAVHALAGIMQAALAADLGCRSTLRSGYPTASQEFSHFGSPGCGGALLAILRASRNWRMRTRRSLSGISIRAA